MKRNITITSENMSYLSTKIEKINKKAEKLGKDMVIIENVTKIEKISEDYIGSIDILYNLDITYDIVSIGNYRFVAKIEHLDNGNIVLRYKDNTEINEKYYNIGGICEHCYTNHKRRYTYLIEDEHGNIKQIGKACMKDYTGYSIDSLISVIEDIDNIEEYLKENSQGGTSNERLYSLKYVMNISKLLIDKYGYLSKSKAIENGIGQKFTSYRLGEIIFTSYMKLDKEYIEIKQKAMEMLNNDITFKEVEDILLWTSNIKDISGDYIANIVALSKQEYISPKYFGYITSMFKAYEKHLENIKKQDEKHDKAIQSEYVGNIGDKLTIEVTLTNYRVIETMYGTSILYIFNDRSGNILTWFTSSYFDYGKGDEITIKATVKEHKVYENTKQTVLTRVKAI